MRPTAGAVTFSKTSSSYKSTQTTKQAKHLSWTATDGRVIKEFNTTAGRPASWSRTATDHCGAVIVIVGGPAGARCIAGGAAAWRDNVMTSNERCRRWFDSISRHLTLHGLSQFLPLPSPVTLPLSDNTFHGRDHLVVFR